MMVGEAAEGPDNLIPIQPARPMAVTIEKTITKTVPIVPVMERTIKVMARITIANINGTRVRLSCNDASGNDTFIMTIPVR